MFKDFKCDCGCGQKLRICHFPLSDKEDIVDVSVLYGRQKKPKYGVVLKGKNAKKVIQYLSRKS